MSKKRSDLKDNNDVQEITEGNASETVDEPAPENDTEETPLPEPPPEKKKERELPEWMVDKLTINEMKFCKLFVEKHPLKCIMGRFYDYNGLVDENALGNEIYCMLRQGVWFGLPKKVTLIMETLRHYCYSKLLLPDTRYIHLQNGKLDLNGNFYSHKEFCINRLNVMYGTTLRYGTAPPIITNSSLPFFWSFLRRKM